MPNQIPKQSYRMAQIQAQTINKEERTVELSFSSESEIDMWFGIEILDHSQGAIRTNYLDNGMAVLKDHDICEQVGVVESYTFGSDRKGRAIARFSNSQDGQEVFQDILDGIRKNVSVRYIRHNTILVEEREGMPVYKTTDWEPVEISIVAIPADVSVGVGRSKDLKDGEYLEIANIAERKKQMPATNLPAINEDEIRRLAEEKGAKSEQQRSAAIAKIGEQYNQPSLAIKFIHEGRSIEDFKDELLKIQSSEPPSAASRSVEETGLDEKEIRKFSFVRLINAMANPLDQRARKEAAFELEACQAASEKREARNNGMIIPVEVLTTPLMGERAGTVNTTVGASLIPTNLLTGSFIDFLKNKTLLMNLATKLTGLVGNVDIPRGTAGNTGYWVGEDTAPTGSNPTYDKVSLALKTVGATSYLTRTMSKQTTLDMEALIRADIALALALAIDSAGFYGTGSDSQPKGIKNSDGINTVAFAAASPTYAELVQMETEIAADNADVSNMAYIFNARMRGHCKTTQKFPDDTNTGGIIWEPGSTVNGYNAGVTNQIATGDVFFGNFADLLIGMWGGIELKVDPFTDSKKGGTNITAFQDIDLAIRHGASFCYGVKP